MKPSIGRIVHLWRGLSMYQSAAIIVCVHDDVVVDVREFSLDHMPLPLHTGVPFEGSIQGNLITDDTPVWRWPERA